MLKLRLFTLTKDFCRSFNKTDGDYFGPSEIDAIRLALSRQGATPISTEMINGRPRPLYGVVFSEIEEHQLKQNSSFKQDIREAYEQFTGVNKHPIFNSAIGKYGQMMLLTITVLR